MTILRILAYPDPKLKRVAKKVDKLDTRIKQVIADMFETHYSAKDCAALAATQLDMPDPPYITVIDFSPKKDQPLCLINAEIIERVGTHKESEGCMSVFPDHIHATVTRSKEITVKYLDESGKEHTLKAEGFMAKCIQHELDHLNGTIYIDHLSRLKRGLVEKRIGMVISSMKSS